MSDIELNREARELKNEKVLSELIMNSQKDMLSRSLLGDWGKDIDDVLSGKVKVKLSWKEKLKYKINFWINKFFKIF